MSENPPDKPGMENFPVVTLSISEHVRGEFPDVYLLERTLCEAFRKILSKLSLFKDPERTELGVSIVDDRKIQELNAKHRGIDKPTDVLSFPVYSRGEIPLELADDDPPRHIGDIVISIQTLQKQALERGMSFNERFTESFIHGILHLLGYEHGNDEDRVGMEDMEERLYTEIFQNIGTL